MLLLTMVVVMMMIYSLETQHHSLLCSKINIGSDRLLPGGLLAINSHSNHFGLLSTSTTSTTKLLLVVASDDDVAAAADDDDDILSLEHNSLLKRERDERDSFPGEPATGTHCTVYGSLSHDDMNASQKTNRIF